MFLISVLQSTLTQCPISTEKQVFCGAQAKCLCRFKCVNQLCSGTAIQI